MARSMWTGSIAFGLANVPVKMYTATESKGIQFNQLNSKTGARIRQKRVDEQTGKEVEYGDIVKGYQITPDRYVTVTVDELIDVMPERTKQIALHTFVDPDQIALHPLAFDKAYYLAPDNGGGKAYALLAEAMRDSNKFAIGTVVIRSLERIVALYVVEDGTIVCHTLFRSDEVRPHDDLGVESAGQISEAERAMAGQLVQALVGDFDWESYKDSYRERVIALIEAKAAGEELPTVEETEQPATSDIMAALEASLAVVRAEKKGSKTKTKKVAA